MTAARVGIIAAILIALSLAVWQPAVALAVALIPGIAIVFVLSRIAPKPPSASRHQRKRR